MLEIPKFDSYDAFCVRVQESIKHELEELLLLMPAGGRKILRDRIAELDKQMRLLRERTFVK